ncbi:MAG: HDIG domain-containing protein [Myxococcales bacterium]|nr:HDIG domain-containing protein [Myxococcales bacterium]
MRLLRWLLAPASALALRADDLRRALIGLLVCALCALCVVEFTRAPDDAVHLAKIAPRTVKAPFEFTYANHAEHALAKQRARQESPPIYVHQVDLLADRDQRVADAFSAGRQRLAQLTGADQPDAVPQLNEELHLLVLQSFLEPLQVSLREADHDALLEAGFSAEAEALARDLLDRAMRDTLIVVSRDQLPPTRRPMVVIRLEEGARSESVLTDLESILVPEQARQRVSLGVLERRMQTGPEKDAAAALARALVTANLSFDALETDKRRAEAAEAVPLQLQKVQRGQTIIRAGEIVTDEQLDMYRALQEHQADQDVPRELLAIGLFLLLLLGSLFHFAATYLHGFSTRVRDVAAGGSLLVFMAVMARLVMASSEGVALTLGFDAEAASVWFLVPVAGAAMLIRLLLGVSWAVVFSVAVAMVCGLVMNQSALLMVYFVISSVAGASAIEHTRERIAVLRAGAVVGVVNAVAVLLIHFVQLYVVDDVLSAASVMRPYWSMGFAFLGGVFGAFLALGLVPLLEAVGFVTDYRLMELANLNHPLLRQLMLRAPGSYHHSVVVGTLAEAGCEAIGANALLAKVSSYFHDIGKAEKPQYFVENQREQRSRHAALSPHASAQIIISHVVDGGRMAREHKLPQPILDNIFMHHGTGVLHFFHAKAQEMADDPDEIDVANFRYPGPKPNTREAGVIMLADKVEAATRTLKQPDEHHIRNMIHRIVNSVIADGQFSECPLNLQEIQTITDTFTSVLLGIYHQRIEYPQTADISKASPASSSGRPSKVPPTPKAATITLDLVPREPATDSSKSDDLDYEAVDHLPRGE